MGRLTLNILLSFAQFEREVTGERIRDKIAASKKKGMWMGGLVPIGYKRENKKLVIDENGAKIVNLIFNKYLELKSVAKLKEFLDVKNICTNSGKNFSKGNLYKLLENKLYIGQIIHKDKSYNGEHEAIISGEIFEKVQQQLYKNRVDKFIDTKSPSNSLLIGKLFDDKNNRMTTSHSNTRNRKYRYYVSQAITKFTKEKAGSLTKISAGEIETFVVTAIKDELSNSNKIQKYISNFELYDQKSILQKCKDSKLYENKLFVRSILSSVTISKDKVVIVLCQNNLMKNFKELANGHANFDEANANTKTPIIIERFIKLTKVSKSNNILILDLNKPNKIIQNNYLINAIVKSYYWNKLILDGDAKTAIDIQKIEGLKDPTYIRDVLNLKFLPPKITEMIFKGTQPPDLSIQDLFKASVVKALI